MKIEKIEVKHFRADQGTNQKISGADTYTHVRISLPRVKWLERPIIGEKECKISGPNVFTNSQNT